jgi:hypothetical protein
MKYILRLFVCGFVLAANHGFSQENNTSVPVQLHAYLISQYGVERAELQLLRIKDLEEASGKCVLTDTSYHILIAKWQSRLNIETDELLRSQIQQRMVLFIPLSQVEHLIR